MPNDDRMFEDNEWTPDELAQLGALGAERRPPAELERRTIESLRASGLLRRRWSITARTALALAAASIVFVAGAVAGYAFALTRAVVRPSDSVVTNAVAQTDSVASAARPTRRVVWF